MSRFQILLSIATCAATHRPRHALRRRGVRRRRRLRRATPRCGGAGSPYVDLSWCQRLNLESGKLPSNFAGTLLSTATCTGAKAEAWCLLIHADASLSLSAACATTPGGCLRAGRGAAHHLRAVGLPRRGQGWAVRVKPCFAPGLTLLAHNA